MGSITSDSQGEFESQPLCITSKLIYGDITLIVKLIICKYSFAEIFDIEIMCGFLKIKNYKK
jgi:hypothetical protein